MCSILVACIDLLMYCITLNHESSICVSEAIVISKRYSLRHHYVLMQNSKLSIPFTNRHTVACLLISYITAVIKVILKWNHNSIPGYVRNKRHAWKQKSTDWSNVTLEQNRLYHNVIWRLNRGMRTDYHEQNKQPHIEQSETVL